MMYEPSTPAIAPRAPDSARAIRYKISCATSQHPGNEHRRGNGGRAEQRQHPRDPKPQPRPYPDVPVLRGAGALPRRDAGQRSPTGDHVPFAPVTFDAAQIDRHGDVLRSALRDQSLQPLLDEWLGRHTTPGSTPRSKAPKSAPSGGASPDPSAIMISSLQLRLSLPRTRITDTASARSGGAPTSTTTCASGCPTSR